MKKTPLYDRHIEDGGKMIEFAGFQMPIQFGNILEEHHHVRTDVGVFDVSHMGEILISGGESAEFLDYLLTNDIGNLPDNQCIYTLMCYPNGNVVDDLLVYKFDREKYMLVTNASNDEKDAEWIEEEGLRFDVEIRHVSLDFGQLALQGPNAESLLASLLGDDVRNIPFFGFMEMQYDDMPLIISRTGYTGEDGFELFMPSEDTIKIYAALFSVQGYGLKPIGLGARDTLRFEVALPLYGHEISDTINPVEARLTYFVDFTKRHFIGKEALLASKADEDRRMLVGFILEGNGIARAGYPVEDEDGNDIGFVTTGYRLDGYEGAIGLAFVPKAFAAIGSKLLVRIRKKTVEATVVKRKFYDKKYKKTED